MRHTHIPFDMLARCLRFGSCTVVLDRIRNKFAAHEGGPRVMHSKIRGCFGSHIRPGRKTRLVARWAPEEDAILVPWKGKVINENAQAQISETLRQLPYDVRRS